MSNASVSKDCFCSNTKILANNYNSVPPRATTFANTLISGTQSIIKSETQSKPIKEDPITNETATPPGSGRSRVPGEIYFPPRGINHYRKTLQCPFPDIFDCNPNANVVEVYKDPYALCEPEYRYDKVIKARNNSKGGNMDLFGNVLKDQTIPNQYYSVSYQGYLNYKKCKFPISKEDAIKPNIFSIRLEIDAPPFAKNVSQVTVTIPLNNDNITRGLVFQPNNQITFVTDINNFSADAIIKNVTFRVDNKAVLTLKNPITLPGADGVNNYFVVLSGNPLIKAENIVRKIEESFFNSIEINSIKYITNDYPNANLSVGDSYKIIYIYELTYSEIGPTKTDISVNVFEFSVKTISINNQFTIITLENPILLPVVPFSITKQIKLTQISLENIIDRTKCYTVVSNNPSYCGNLVTYDGLTYPNRTFRDVAAVDSSAQIARRRYKNISCEITKSPNKDFGISKCGNYIGGGQAEYRNIQKKSTICSEAYALSKIRQNNKFICPPIVKEESKGKEIIDTGVVVCIGIPDQGDNAGVERKITLDKVGQINTTLVSSNNAEQGQTSRVLNRLFYDNDGNFRDNDGNIIGSYDTTTYDISGNIFSSDGNYLGNRADLQQYTEPEPEPEAPDGGGDGGEGDGGGGDGGGNFSTGTDNLNPPQDSGGTAGTCVDFVFQTSTCNIPRPIEFWKEFFSQYGDNLLIIEHLEIKSVKKGQNTSDILNEIFGERLYGIKGDFIYNVKSSFRLTNEFSTLIEFKNLVSVRDIFLAGQEYGDFKGIVFDNLIYLETFNFGDSLSGGFVYLKNTTTPILFSFKNLKQALCSIRMSVIFTISITDTFIASKGIILNVPNLIYIGNDLYIFLSTINIKDNVFVDFLQLNNTKLKVIKGDLVIGSKTKTNSNELGIIEFPSLERIGASEDEVNQMGVVDPNDPINFKGYLIAERSRDIKELLFPELKRIRFRLFVSDQTSLTKIRFPKINSITDIIFADNPLFSYNEANMRISMPSMNNSCIPGTYDVIGNADNDKTYPPACNILYIVGGISYDKNSNSVYLNVSSNSQSNINSININEALDTIEITSSFSSVNIGSQEYSYINGGLFNHAIYKNVPDPQSNFFDRGFYILNGLHCINPPYAIDLSGGEIFQPIKKCYSGCSKDYGDDPYECSGFGDEVIRSTFFSADNNYDTQGTDTPIIRVGGKVISLEQDSDGTTKTFAYIFGGGNYNGSNASGLDLLTNNNGAFPTFVEDIGIIDIVANTPGLRGKMNFLSSVPGFTTNEMWNFAINKSLVGEAMIIGGVTYDSNTNVYTTLNTVAKYNFIAKSWTVSKLLNRQREHAMCVFYEPTDTHYVIGGKDRNASVQILSNLEISTDDGATWTLRQDIPLNIARCNAVCEIIGTYIYVIGGESEAPNYSLDAIERLNLENIDAGWELLEIKFPYSFTGGAGIVI